MTKHSKEVLKQLSKEQLIYLIEQLYHSQFKISETCVDESKWHINSKEAIEKIRKCIYNMPSLYNADDVKAYIDMKMEKITAEEYRKNIGLD